MRPKFTLMISSIVLLASLGAGCGQQTTAPAAPVTNNEVQPPPAQVSDNCGNPYYPFKQGLAITYQMTRNNKSAGPDYTIRTVDVKGTKADIQAEVEGKGTADMTADCHDGSVALEGSSGLSSALEGVQFKTTVVSSTGTSMAANVKAGATWSQAETVKMDITGGQAGMAGSTMTLSTNEQSKAIGEETVVVPAGTYQAMKIEVTRKTDSSLTMASGAKLGSIPSTTEKSTQWWVKGIGMVKDVTVTQDGTTVTEAKAVTGA